MFARYRQGLEQELRRSMPNFTPKLDTLLAYHLGWVDDSGMALSSSSSRGKALRPTLCLFSCEALCGHWESALAAAAALEYVHNFSLIHDDIQDGDRERRHRPTVWSLWGQPKALVAGNTMQSVADAIIYGAFRTVVDPQKALQASVLLTQGYLEMIIGQCLDLSREGDLNASLEGYLRMVALKTGSLFRCSMAIGALIGGGDEQAVGAFAKCGVHLGRAFQIRDDVLGIWGAEAATGKVVGSDIRRKKMSFPVVYALEKTSGVARNCLTRALSKKELEDSDVNDVLMVLDQIDAQKYSNAFASENANIARVELENVVASSWAKAEFEGLVQFLTARDH
jgi:geranylgeranyl diphosphate synthase type I